MKRYKTACLIRMSELLKAQCHGAAAKGQLAFSEWARQAFEDKLAADNKRKRKHAA